MSKPALGDFSVREDLLPTEHDVRFYEENGYWIGPRVIDEARLERLREAMERVYQGQHETGHEPWSASWRPGDSPSALRKTDNAFWADLTIRALALDPTIGAMAARLARSEEIRLWHDQLLFKPGQGPQSASSAANIGWHQDRHYWQNTADNLLTAWVPFDDVNLDNGCMQFVPGSHRWGLLAEGDFFTGDLDELARKIERATGKEFKPIPVVLKAGQPSFHHCLTIHGSGPNTTDRPRRSLAIHLAPKGARWITGTPCDDHMNSLLMRHQGGKPGDLFEGPLWPRLWPPDPHQEIRPGPSHRQITAR